MLSRGGPLYGRLARKVFCISRADRCRLFTASPDNRALDSPAPRATAKAPRYRENPKHGPWAPCPEHPILAPRSPLVRFEGKYPCRLCSCRSHFAGLPQDVTPFSFLPIFGLQRQPGAAARFHPVGRLEASRKQAIEVRHRSRVNACPAARIGDDSSEQQAHFAHELTLPLNTAPNPSPAVLAGSGPVPPPPRPPKAPRFAVPAKVCPPRATGRDRLRYTWVAPASPFPRARKIGVHFYPNGRS